jgi:hypothetical protein
MERATDRGDHRRLRSIAAEFVVVSSVFVLYRWGRIFTRDADTQAMHNARKVIDFERAFGIFSEKTVQGWALGSDTVIDILNRYYVMVHFPVTIAFLVWAYLRHNTAYRFVRTWFVMVTLSALVIHVGFPLAPPRMTSGFVDTLQQYGPRIYNRDPRRSVANQFAAMPSLHFGWSLKVAVSFIAIKRSRRSLVILAHPVVTLLAIVATGNHYWLDAIVAGILACLTAVVLIGWRFVRDGHILPVAADADEPSDAQWVLMSEEVDDESVDDPRAAARRRDRCRQHSGAHERIELDECSAGWASGSDHPPGQLTSDS